MTNAVTWFTKHNTHWNTGLFVQILIRYIVESFAKHLHSWVFTEIRSRLHHVASVTQLLPKRMILACEVRVFEQTVSCFLRVANTCLDVELIDVVSATGQTRVDVLLNRRNTESPCERYHGIVNGIDVTVIVCGSDNACSWNVSQGHCFLKDEVLLIIVY